MKVLWAIQRFAINDNDGTEIPSAIEKAEQETTVLEIPPFQYDNIVCPDHDGPIIPYGGTKMIEAIMEDKDWTCWFNDQFKYHIEMEKLNERMFNGDGKYMRLRDFCPSLWKEHKYVFIRPDKDTKEFAGNVVKPEEFMRWFKKLQKVNSSEYWGVDEDTEVIVAPASRVDEEWRLFVVNNCIISGSRYRANHTLSIDPHVPQEALDYARETIEIWQPAPVFVIDICRVSNDLHVLEIGDFHSAGFYASDKELIVKAVSEYALKS